MAQTAQTNRKEIMVPTTMSNAGHGWARSRSESFKARRISGPFSGPLISGNSADCLLWHWFHWSEWEDLNLRPLPPESSALPLSLFLLTCSWHRRRRYSCPRRCCGGSPLPGGGQHHEYDKPLTGVIVPEASVVSTGRQNSLAARFARKSPEAQL